MSTLRSIVISICASGYDYPSAIHRFVVSVNENSRARISFCLRKRSLYKTSAPLVHGLKTNLSFASFGN